jgi:protein-S-isoprenylcysteine O-methyltransferase Ste14
MTITTVLAYVLIGAYFVIERLLRKGKQAISVQPGQADRGSSYLMWGIGLLNLWLVFLAPVLNHYQIGYWNNELIRWLGLLLMFAGLTIRYLAANTLGQFYTRTLQIVEGHQIVDRGLYHVIRHPGYLGVFLLEMGAGLAVSNWIVLLVVLLIGSGAKLYRIQTEEKMLEREFGEPYRSYSKRTWRLIPFLY